MTTTKARWVLAKTPCNWCREAGMHWHSVVGWNEAGEPRVGVVVSTQSPTDWGEAYAVLVDDDLEGAELIVPSCGRSVN